MKPAQLLADYPIQYHNAPQFSAEVLNVDFSSAGTLACAVLLWSVRLGAQPSVPVLLPTTHPTLHVDAGPIKLYHAHLGCGPYAPST